MKWGMALAMLVFSTLKFRKQLAKRYDGRWFYVPGYFTVTRATSRPHPRW